MGLYTIDNVCKEEWQRRMMRRHHIKRILITLGELLFLGAVIAFLVWAGGEMKP